MERVWAEGGRGKGVVGGGPGDWEEGVSGGAVNAGWAKWEGRGQAGDGAERRKTVEGVGVVLVDREVGLRWCAHLNQTFPSLSPSYHHLSVPAAPTRREEQTAGLEKVWVEAHLLAGGNVIWEISLEMITTDLPDQNASLDLTTQS